MIQTAIKTKSGHNQDRCTSMLFVSVFSRGLKLTLFESRRLFKRI